MKGKVERFNGYLRRSFYVPLVARLKPFGVKLDAVTANAEVRRWLTEVANERIHGTTRAKPIDRLQEERPHLQALPPPWRGDIAGARPRPPSAGAQSRERPPVVVERMRAETPTQHPLAVYQQLLEPLWRDPEVLA